MQTARREAFGTLFGGHRPSAVVPLCFPQTTSALSRRLRREHRDLVVWWATPVEVRNTLARLAADGAISPGKREAAFARRALLRDAWREVLPTDGVRSLAEQLAGHHHLRAGDLFQLAAALDWCNHRPRNRSFVCFDRRLCESARQAGFDVYP